MERLVLVQHTEVPCSECIFLTVGCRVVRPCTVELQHILPTANVLTQCSHEKSRLLAAVTQNISVNPQGLQRQELFLLASEDDWGITLLLAVGTCVVWVTSANLYSSVSCLFSPKPHFVYKWWLYVKTFCLSSNQCLGSFSTPHMHTDITDTHTHHTLLNCLVHCNMNGVFLLQSKLKPLYFSLSSVYVQMNRIFVMYFLI